MDISILNTTFAKQDNPGLDTLDPRWSEITGMVTEGKFEDAARMSQGLLAEEIYDVRLVGYLCFGVFLEQGLAGLPDMFRSLSGVLDTNWDAVGPAATREKAAQNTLSWLLKQVLKKVQREETTKGPDWQTWIGSVMQEQVDEALTELRKLQGAADTALGDKAPPVMDSMSKFREWLTAFRNQAKRPAPPPAPEEFTESPPTQLAEVPEEGQPAKKKSSGLGVEGSYHLEQLVRKLEAFERLITEEKFPRAHIVADDISTTLTNFDPILYFPALFTKFIKLMAIHTGALSEYEGARESPDWKALQLLYKTDLEEFLGL